MAKSIKISELKGMSLEDFRSLSSKFKEVHRETLVRLKAYLNNEGINYIGKPEFHDSRIGGPGSAPVFWHISINDIEKKLSEFGFQTEVIHIGPNNQSFSQVIYARKLV